MYAHLCSLWSIVVMRLSATDAEGAGARRTSAYTLSEEDKTRSYIEVSGRKGFGVKADDLLPGDRLRQERSPTRATRSSRGGRALSPRKCRRALRYFMLKFTSQSLSLSDFKEALSFEGETGPVTICVVRAPAFLRKRPSDPQAISVVKLPGNPYGRFRAIPRSRVRQ